VLEQHHDAVHVLVVRLFGLERFVGLFGHERHDLLVVDVERKHLDVALQLQPERRLLQVPDGAVGERLLLEGPDRSRLHVDRRQLLPVAQRA